MKKNLLTLLSLLSFVLFSTSIFSSEVKISLAPNDFESEKVSDFFSKTVIPTLGPKLNDIYKKLYPHSPHIQIQITQGQRRGLRMPYILSEDLLQVETEDDLAFFLARAIEYDKPLDEDFQKILKQFGVTDNDTKSSFNHDVRAYHRLLQSKAYNPQKVVSGWIKYAYPQQTVRDWARKVFDFYKTQQQINNLEYQKVFEQKEKEFSIDPVAWARIEYGTIFLKKLKMMEMPYSSIPTSLSEEFSLFGEFLMGVAGSRCKVIGTGLTRVTYGLVHGIFMDLPRFFLQSLLNAKDAVDLRALRNYLTTAATTQVLETSKSLLHAARKLENCPSMAHKKFIDLLSVLANLPRDVKNWSVNEWTRFLKALQDLYVWAITPNPPKTYVQPTRPLAREPVKTAPVLTLKDGHFYFYLQGWDNFLNNVPQDILPIMKKWEEDFLSERSEQGRKLAFLSISTEAPIPRKLFSEILVNNKLGLFRQRSEGHQLNLFDLLKRIGSVTLFSLFANQISSDANLREHFNQQKNFEVSENDAISGEKLLHLYKLKLIDEEEFKIWFTDYLNKEIDLNYPIPIKKIGELLSQSDLIASISPSISAFVTNSIVNKVWELMMAPTTLIKRRGELYKMVNLHRSAFKKGNSWPRPLSLEEVFTLPRGQMKSESKPCYSDIFHHVISLEKEPSESSTTIMQLFLDKKILLCNKNEWAYFLNFADSYMEQQLRENASSYNSAPDSDFKKKQGEYLKFRAKHAGALTTNGATEMYQRFALQVAKEQGLLSATTSDREKLSLFEIMVKNSGESVVTDELMSEILSSHREGNDQNRLLEGFENARRFIITDRLQQKRIYQRMVNEAIKSNKQGKALFEYINKEVAPYDTNMRVAATEYALDKIHATSAETTSATKLLEEYQTENQAHGDLPLKVITSMLEYFGPPWDTKDDQFQLLFFLLGFNKEAPQFIQNHLLLSPQQIQVMFHRLEDQKKWPLIDSYISTRSGSILYGFDKNGEYLNRIIEKIVEKSRPKTKEVMTHLIHSLLNALEANNAHQQRSMYLANLLTAASALNNPEENPTETRSVTDEGKILKLVLESFGPLGIKLGQFLFASDILDKELSQELRELLDKAIPLSRYEVMDYLKKYESEYEIGNRLGSGSISHVMKLTHKGVTPPEVNKHMVVKILRDNRPDEENKDFKLEALKNVRKGVQQLHFDSEIFELMVNDLVQRHGVRYKALGPIVAASVAAMKQEIEIVNANANAEMMRTQVYDEKTFKGRVKVPLVWKIDKKLLFEDFVPGIPLDQLKKPVDRFKAAKEILSREGTVLFRHWNYKVEDLNHETLDPDTFIEDEAFAFDADFHPGNEMIEVDKKGKFIHHRFDLNEALSQEDVGKGQRLMMVKLMALAQLLKAVGPTEWMMKEIKKAIVQGKENKGYATIDSESEEFLSQMNHLKKSLAQIFPLRGENREGMSESAAYLSLLESLRDVKLLDFTSAQFRAHDRVLLEFIRALNTAEQYERYMSNFIPSEDDKNKWPQSRFKQIVSAFAKAYERKMKNEMGLKGKVEVAYTLGWHKMTDYLKDVLLGPDLRDPACIAADDEFLGAMGTGY